MLYKLENKIIYFWFLNSNLGEKMKILISKL